MAISFEESIKNVVSETEDSNAGVMVLAEESDIVPLDDSGSWNRDTAYDWYDNLVDANLSTINQNKEITLSSSQLNILNEQNSQYIRFEMSRYYDGYDLSNAGLSIHYEPYGRSDLHAFDKPVNVEYNDTKIRFGWLLKGNATQITGTLTFEIRADGVISYTSGEDGSIKNRAYTWKTKANTSLNILQSICKDNDCDNIEIDTQETWVQELVELVVNQIAQTEVENYKNAAAASAEAAASSATAAAQSASEAATTAENTATEIVETKMSNYALTSTVDTKISDTKTSLENTINTKEEALKTDIDELNEALNSLDGLAKFRVAYDSSKSEMVFYNGEVIIGGPYIVDPSQNFINKNIGDLTLLSYLYKEGEESISLASALVRTFEKFDKYYDKNTIDEKLATIDISKALEPYATKEYVQEEILKVDVSEQLKEYAKQSEVESISIDVYGGDKITESGTEKVEGLISRITNLEQNQSEVAEYSLKEQFTSNNEQQIALYKNDEEQDIITIKGGGGGTGPSSYVTLSITYISPSSVTISSEQSANIEYEFSGIDNAGENINCKAKWSVNGTLVETQEIQTGSLSFDPTQYLTTGNNKVVLVVTDVVYDDSGVETEEYTTKVNKVWTIQKADIRLTSTFDEAIPQPIGQIAIPYTPWGTNIEKTIHFILDNEEVAAVTTYVSGSARQQYLTISEHGAHDLEMYITFDSNGTEIKTNSIHKTIVAYDVESSDIIIGTSIKEFTAEQYDTKEIPYTVWWNTKLSTPTIVRSDGTTDRLDTPGQSVWYYNYSASFAENESVKTIPLTIGYLKDEETIITNEITATITKLDIDVEAVTDGLVFDFNPLGKTNIEENKIWTNGNEVEPVSLITENFDWINGGYQTDSEGKQYFCIKAGTKAKFSYGNLFYGNEGKTAKDTGREFKLVFKAVNVKDIDTPFLTCLNSNIGLEMKPHEANVYAGSADSALYLPYSEEDKIEFEFNIASSSDAVPAIRGYEDGMGTRGYVHTQGQLNQSESTVITLGSNDCDLHVYRFKVYNKGLTDEQILNNFIADAGSAADIRDRYRRNQIYEIQGDKKVLTPESLAMACPWLRVIKLKADHFTTDKSDIITDSTIEQIYLNGRPQDNWIAEGCGHSGQGTSSNDYWFSGRNLDFIMQYYKKKNTEIKDPHIYQSKITYNTDKTAIVKTEKTDKELGKVSFTDSSVPVGYLNVKVNIASSDNANNAEIARRYNQYNPYKRPFVNHNIDIDFIKDTMEFYNCVVFLCESNTDLTTHNQFNDTEYHFYALGNIGDSKKTDNTRVTDPNDYNEVIIEIMDYNKPLSEFPTWDKAEAIFAEETFDEYEVDSNNAEETRRYDDTYGWRYDNFRDDSDAALAQARWIDLYKIIVNADGNTDFYTELPEWFVLDSALYYYLFTERYTMVDNRAKNSFWHFGKTGEYKAITHPKVSMIDLYYELQDDGSYLKTEDTAIQDGKVYYCEYRWDLSFDYDNDTALGINNAGKMTMPYGVEDMDKDAAGAYYFRAAESNFFAQLRDKFKDEMRAMFIDREQAGAWSATNLITQFDNSQAQFPEELVRKDIERKYIRTYSNAVVDNSIQKTDENGNVTVGETRFFENMMNGLKKYHRRNFERNQELYMSGKYSGTVARQSVINMRFGNPTNVETDYSLKITPYANSYIGWSYSSGGATYNTQRAYKGVEFTIPYTGTSADLTNIYGAGMVQKIGDLSKAYVYDSAFGGGTKLQSLTLGSADENYTNNITTKITVGNKLLEYLDVQNLSALTELTNLDLCLNLKELKAKGSGLTTAVFGNGARLENIELPATVNKLTLQNLLYLESFSIEGYDNLKYLTLENISINTLDIVENANNLVAAMIYDVDWVLTDTTLLNKLYNLKGLSANGEAVGQAYLTGKIYVNRISSRDYALYKEAWPELTITYPEGGLIPYYKITYANWNGEIEEEIWVEEGSYLQSPIEKVPTKESSLDTVYTFAYWSISLNNPKEYSFNDPTQTIHGDLILYAIYTPSKRVYTVRYENPKMPDYNPLYEASGYYGDIINFKSNSNNAAVENGIPIYRGAESVYDYYLFREWDKSGLIDGKDDVKIITAQFDFLDWNANYNFDKDLNDFTPIELYAFSKLINTRTEMLEKVVPGEIYNVELGYNYNASDINSNEIIKNSKITIKDAEQSTVFSKNKVIETGINLFEEDRDFTIVVDYNFLKATESYVAPTLLSCHDGVNRGIKIVRTSLTSSTVTVYFNEKTQTFPINERDVLVFRYKKANEELGQEAQFYLYSSSLSSSELQTYSINSIYEPVSENTSLVLGGDANVATNRATGEIYWMKIWYADLGDEICKQLVNYPNIILPFEFAKYYGYSEATAGSPPTNMTFIASQLLDQKKAYGTQSNATWENSYIRTFINDRIYKALPTQIKSLIKLTKIVTNDGQNNRDYTNTEDYLYLPALLDISTASSAEYLQAETSGLIPTFIDNTSRIKRYSTGEAGYYYTRSPQSTVAIWKIASNGVPYTQTDPVTNTSDELWSNIERGILVMFSI